MSESSTTPNRRTFMKQASALAALSTPGIATAATAQNTNETKLKQAITRNHDTAIKRLQDWIALPSIAAENLNYPAGPEYMAQLAKDAGFQHVEIVPTGGKPGVFATLDAGAKKTLGVYFMYDVKQFDPAEWSSPPLEARLVDRPGLGKIMVGRGAQNQKGPEATFLAALHAFKTAGIKLPVNLVLVAEGEEEIASPNFPAFLKTPQVMQALKGTVGVLVPGINQNINGNAAISLGAKGAIEMELIVDAEKWGRGPKHDIHSSEKARVDSPPWHLVGALASLVSGDGNTVNIDGVPEMVMPLTARQKELIIFNSRGDSEETVKKALGVENWIDNMSFQDSLIRLAQEPTINIQGLVAGYSGPGGKTILPHRAVAKVEMRLVPNMTKEDTLAKMRAHLDKRGFQNVEIKVTGGYGPTQTDENAGIIKAGRAVYQRQGIETTLVPRGAGSWPGVNFTGAPISRPVISFGAGYGDGMHAPNEFYLIESNHPKIQGMDGVTFSFVDFLYQVAAVG